MRGLSWRAPSSAPMSFSFDYDPLINRLEKQSTL